MENDTKIERFFDWMYSTKLGKITFCIIFCLVLVVAIYSNMERYNMWAYYRTQTTETQTWKKPTTEILDAVALPPMYGDGFDRIGQSWEWVTNDKGEWLYRKVD